MRFSTVVALSAAALASSAVAYPASARSDDSLFARGHAKKTSKSATAATNGAALAKKLPNEIKAEIGKQGLDGSKSAADRAKTLGTSQKDVQKAYKSKANEEIKNGPLRSASWGLQDTLDTNRQLRREVDDIVELLTRSFDEEEALFARGTAKKTSKSATAATNGAALAKKLPNEIKAEIGKQGLDGSRSAADRAKTLGTSQKDIQKAYQPKLNKEIEGGQVPSASWGLQETLDSNRKLRRDLEDLVELLARSLDDDESLFARGTNKKTSKSSTAATNGAALAKKLPNEIKAEVGKQGLDGSKAAADRAKTLGTSQKDIQKAYQPKLNKEIKGGQAPGASWGLQETLDTNRKL